MMSLKVCSRYFSLNHSWLHPLTKGQHTQTSCQRVMLCSAFYIICIKAALKYSLILSTQSWRWHQNIHQSVTRLYMTFHPCLWIGGTVAAGSSSEVLVTRHRQALHNLWTVFHMSAVAEFAVLLLRHSLYNLLSPSSVTQVDHGSVSLVLRRKWTAALSLVCIIMTIVLTQLCKPVTCLW